MEVSVGKVDEETGELTLADTLLCADLSPILHGVQTEVNIRYRLLGLYGLTYVVRVVHGEMGPAMLG